MGGPGGSIKQSNTRNIIVCDNIMTTIVELIKKQISIIGGQNIYFKVPQYSNAECQVTKV